jgi:predicted amidophosphoribosyltransferase
MWGFILGLVIVFIIGMGIRMMVRKKAASQSTVPSGAATFCPKCGAAVQPGATFCAGCGQKLG